MPRVSPRRAPRVAAIASIAATLVAGCAAAPEPATREYLDELTAATVTVATRGVVFARSRTEFAVNARDYLTLVPVDVNRAGSHVLYLYCYAWSTIDKRAGEEAPARYQVLADGRQIELTPTTATLRSLGFGELPVVPPARDARPFVVITSREVLQFLARAQDVSVVATRSGLGERYDLWEDGRPAIEEFLHGGARP